MHVDEELFLPQNDSDQRDFDDIPMNIAQSPNPIENQVPSVSAVSVSELSSQNSLRSDPHEHLKTKDVNNGWSYTVRDLQRLPFTAEERLGVDVESHSTVESIFCYIIDDEFLDMMVEQTNIYAAQISSDAGRLARWKDVDRNMMKKFLGIILYTSIVVKPTLECYWKKDPIYYHPLMHKLGMSYNTFTLMLRCWHFADNSAPRDPNNRLYKVQLLVDKIVNKSQQLLTPGDCVIIDESMVPFKGRLLFRQYNPSKTNKYGIKIYKLCTADGYTWKYEIYCGADETIENLDKPGSIVVKLCRNLLGAGRLIVADNFYTSFPLATYLLAHQTDLCGTLRKNRKHLPEYVKAKKLQRGEIIASQKENVTVSKWKDKRDVLMISTCHSDEMCMTRQRNPKPKPKVVLEYNSKKKGIDFSDQLCSYQSPIRKSLIWYKKIAIDMIFGVAITNSVVVYNKLHPTAVRKEKITILQAKSRIIRLFLNLEEDTSSIHRPSSSSIISIPPSRRTTNHYLEEIPRKDDKKIIRRRCSLCYDEQRKLGLTVAQAKSKAKKVDHICKQCEKPFCLACFAKFHLG